MTDIPRHKRLTEALCEAVDYGFPTCIRMSDKAWIQLLGSLDGGNSHKVDMNFDNPRYEGVAVNIEPGFNGCVVEHDNRYNGVISSGPPHAVPETVVVMRDSLKSAIIAWTDSDA